MDISALDPSLVLGCLCVATFLISFLVIGIAASRPTTKEKVKNDA